MRAGLEHELQALLTRRQKLEAVKLLREETGMRLREALERSAQVSQEVAREAQVVELLRRGQVLGAIQIVRARTGLDLRGANAYVYHVREQHGLGRRLTLEPASYEHCWGRPWLPG